MKIRNSIECWLFHRELAAFLLLRCPMTNRHPEYWQPVTGGVLYKESFLEACIREVWEETGIRLSPSNLMTVIDEFRVYVPEYRMEVRKPVFTVETTVETVKISDEHLAYQWIAPEDVPSFLFWESSKTSFNAVKAFYSRRSDESE